MAEGELAFDGEETGRITPPGSVQILFEPPIAIEIEDAQERESRLAVVIADKVIPRLLALHNSISGPEAEITIHAGEPEIAELSRLVVGPDNSEALDYVLSLRNAGLSLDLLHLELLEPTARHLGELWEADRLDFIDVSIGLNRLQRLVHVFAGLDDVPPYDEKRRALIVTTPDEQHILGNTIVQRFFRAGGWYVCSGPVVTIEDVSTIVSREWFGVVGFSLAAEKHMGSLARSVSAVREASQNRTVGIMVGGPAFTDRPDRAIEVGADGTAVNAPAAVDPCQETAGTKSLHREFVTVSWLTVILIDGHPQLAA